MDISNKIKEIRNKHNLSQEVFAEKLGVSRQSVISWEKGKTIPQTDMLIRICETFNYKLDFFVEGKSSIEHSSNNKSEAVARFMIFDKKHIKEEIKEDFVEFRLWISIILTLLRLIVIVIGIILLFYLENLYIVLDILLTITIFLVIGFIKGFFFKKYLSKKYIKLKEKGNLISPFFPIYYYVDKDVVIKYKDDVIFSCPNELISGQFNIINEFKESKIIDETPRRKEIFYKLLIFRKDGRIPFEISFDVDAINSRNDIRRFYKQSHISCLKEAIISINRAIKK